MIAYDSIRQGLSEALAFAAGDTAGATLHQVNVATVNVAASPASTGPSQSHLVRLIGVAKGTLLN